MGRGSERAVVEAAYRLEPTADAWLTGLVEAARPALDHGAGLMALTFQVGPRSEFQPTSRLVSAGPLAEGTEAIFRAVAGALRPEPVTEAWGNPLALDTASEVWKRSGRPGGAAARFEAAHAFGVRDSLAAKMVDATGAGFLFCAPLPQEASIEPSDETRWRRVMTHVLAGLRLRGALQGGDGDAVLHPDGRGAHAEGDARSRGAQDSLRAAAVCMDRARTAAVDPDRALEDWRGLVNGRWSLLDRFDRDGRRFLVARRNDPVVPSPRALSVRERQVLAYAALGYSNKHIAYSLGLASSTVSSHLRGGMRKLGVDTCAELAATVRTARAVEAPS